MWENMWRRSSGFWEKLCWHWEQEKGLSLLWILRWDSRFPGGAEGLLDGVLSALESD